MKRFVTYLYEYEKEVKTKNTGFIRVDIREPFVNIEVCVRKFLREEEKGRVYVLVARGGLYGVEVGAIQVQNGQGDLHLKLLAKNLQETGYSIEEVAGIGICFPNKNYLASCWMDDYAQAIGSASFAVWKKEKEQSREITSNIHSCSQLEKTDFGSTKVDLSERSVVLCATDSSLQGESLRMAKNSTNMYPQDTKGEKELHKDILYTYQKIDLPQLRELPKQGIHYERNAFVIHGFWNYGYLILKTEVEEDKKTISLGIPGIYERQEATMAIVFGFPKFETLPESVITTQTSQKLSFKKEEIEKNQQPKEKTFGCWFVSFGNESL